MVHAESFYFDNQWCDSCAVLRQKEDSFKISIQTVKNPVCASQHLQHIVFSPKRQLSRQRGKAGPVYIPVYMYIYIFFFNQITDLTSGTDRQY